MATNELTPYILYADGMALTREVQGKKMGTVVLLAVAEAENRLKELCFFFRKSDLLLYIRGYLGKFDPDKYATLIKNLEAEPGYTDDWEEKPVRLLGKPADILLLLAMFVRGKALLPILKMVEGKDNVFLSLRGGHKVLIIIPAIYGMMPTEVAFCYSQYQVQQYLAGLKERTSPAYVASIRACMPGVSELESRTDCEMQVFTGAIFLPVYTVATLAVRNERDWRRYWQIPIVGMTFDGQPIIGFGDWE